MCSERQYSRGLTSRRCPLTKDHLQKIILKLTLLKVCFNVDNPGAEYIGKERHVRYFLNLLSLIFTLPL